MEMGQEEIDSMSPEQIAEMQRQNCLFCHIIGGRADAKKVYEDNKVIAVLDINPANPGHVLLLPKDHYAIMPQIPDEILSHMFMVAKGMSKALLKAFHAEGTNIFVANGGSSGQKAQHFMVHIIPRKQGDNIVAFNIPKARVGEDELRDIKARIKPKISSVFGLKEEVLDLDKLRKKETEKTKKEEEKKKPEEKVFAEAEKEEEEISLDDISRLFKKDES